MSHCVGLQQCLSLNKLFIRESQWVRSKNQCKSGKNEIPTTTKIRWQPRFSDFGWIRNWVHPQQKKFGFIWKFWGIWILKCFIIQEPVIFELKVSTVWCNRLMRNLFPNQKTCEQIELYKVVSTFSKVNQKLWFQNQQASEDPWVRSEKGLKGLSKCGNLAGDNHVQIAWICWMVLELSQTEEQSSISLIASELFSL